MTFHAGEFAWDCSPSPPEMDRSFSSVANRVAFGGVRALVTRCGKPLVEIMPVADLEPLTAAAGLEVLEQLKTLARLEQAGPAAPERTSVQASEGAERSGIVALPHDGGLHHR